MSVPGRFRAFGSPPYTVAVVHGGPGAAGEMAPVARELAASWGVLEPLQGETSLQGQIEELNGTLSVHGELPLVLIGFSWGAWLSMLCAAEHPSVVRKLILVGSGSFEEHYTRQLEKTRLERLTIQERSELNLLSGLLQGPVTAEARRTFIRVGQLLEKADAFDPVSCDEDLQEPSLDIFREAWEQGAALRRSGELLLRAAAVKCPVVAIHGDRDPHPADGVRLPLSGVLENFRFILLERCGHKPWIERQARAAFFSCIKAELNKT